jgi:hypothetical protein
MPQARKTTVKAVKIAGPGSSLIENFRPPPLDQQDHAIALEGR